MTDTLLPELQAIARGDESAIRRLFKQEYASLLGFVRRQGMTEFDAEEIAMDVFMKVVLALRTSTSLPELSDPKTFKLYFLRVARNALIDHVRKAAAQKRQDSPDEAQENQGSSGTYDDWLPPDFQEATEGPAEVPAAEDRTEDRQALERAFVKVAREHPTTVDLIRLIAEGATSDEVAEFFGISVGVARDRMYRARMLLKSALEQEGIR